MLEQLYRWLNLSEAEQDTLIKQLVAKFLGLVNLYLGDETSSAS